jgi:hypothetical protein
VFKIAATDSRVREFLASKGWEFQGKDEEMEMDSYREKKTGKGYSSKTFQRIFR